MPAATGRQCSSTRATKFDSTYGLCLNYAPANFKLSLQLRNFFNRNGYFTSTFFSPRFDESSREWASDLSRYIQLSVAYTIPYGKKVNHGGELQASGGIGSAILK